MILDLSLFGIYNRCMPDTTDWKWWNWLLAVIAVIILGPIVLAIGVSVHYHYRIISYWNISLIIKFLYCYTEHWQMGCEGRT